MRIKKVQKWRDSEKLQLYRETVDELCETNLVKKGLNSSASIKVSEKHGIQYETTWPDVDNLRSFLLTFRKFISDGEPIFLNHILNLCIKSVKDKTLKEDLIKGQKVWKQICKSPMGILKGESYSPKDRVNLYLNGEFFHSDKKKRQILKSLKPNLEMLYRSEFIAFLVEATHIIFYVDNIIKIAINKGLVNFIKEKKEEEGTERQN